MCIFIKWLTWVSDTHCTEHSALLSTCSWIPSDRLKIGRTSEQKWSTKWRLSGDEKWKKKKWKLYFMSHGNWIYIMHISIEDMHFCKYQLVCCKDKVKDKFYVCSFERNGQRSKGCPLPIPSSSTSSFEPKDKREPETGLKNAFTSVHSRKHHVISSHITRNFCHSSSVSLLPVTLFFSHFILIPFYPKCSSSSSSSIR